MKIKYMHTIDGRPAKFVNQIGFVTPRTPVVLCDSMDQIRRERRLSVEWRKKQGWTSSGFNYGYQRIITTHTP